MTQPKRPQDRRLPATRVPREQDGVFDLDAASAKRKAKGGTDFDFLWGGEEFTIPAIREWDLRLQTLLSEGEIAGVMRSVMGKKQFRRFLEHGPTIGDMESLMEAAGKNEGAGDTLGE